MNPILSIGLPVYNGAEHVGGAIESALNQTLTDFELVISDNASTDNTKEVCEQYLGSDERIRFHRNETNLGAAGNFNRVVELSRGRYFKFLGHDDIIYPTAMEKAVAVMEAEDDVSLVYWLDRIVDPDGNTLREYVPSQGFRIDGTTPGHRFRQMLFWRSKGFESDPFYGVMRRTALDVVRPQRVHMHSNYIFLQEIVLTGKLVTIPEVLAVCVYNDKRVTVPQMIRFLDPEGTIRFPHFNKAKEYFRVGLTHGNMPLVDRVLTGAALIGYHFHPRELKGFIWDLAKSRNRTQEAGASDLSPSQLA